MDPSGNTPVEIWAAAFIEPAEIDFIYPDRGVVATWHGDDRSWYGGTDPLPVSSRVWWWIQFDTCAGLSTFSSRQDTGETVATYINVERPPWWFPIPIPMGIERHIERDKADPPNPARLDYTLWRNPPTDLQDEAYAVTIEGSVSNPLVPLSPTIDIHYFVYFSLTWNRIEISGHLDRFPWHEIWVAVDGRHVIGVQQPPQGPAMNPADLALPPEPFSTSPTPLRSRNLSCNQGRQTPSLMFANAPQAIMDNLDPNCLFA